MFRILARYFKFSAKTALNLGSISQTIKHTPSAHLNTQKFQRVRLQLIAVKSEKMKTLKGKRLVSKEENLLKAVKAIKNGMSKANASAKFKIPLSTIDYNLTRVAKSNRKSRNLQKVKTENDVQPLIIEDIRTLEDEESEGDEDVPWMSIDSVNCTKQDTRIIDRLCRLCADKERPGESFERIFERNEIAVQIFALTGVQVIIDDAVLKFVFVTCLFL